MPEDKSFRFALLISIIIHGIAFLNPPALKFLVLKPREKKIEINYLKIEPTGYYKLEDNKKGVNIKHTPSVQMRKLQPPPFVKRDEIFRESIKTVLPKPVLPKPDIISVKKIIQLKPLDVEKINNPIYINYYQTVREKIRRCAYQNYSRSDTGQVYLTFIIISDGNLGDVRINDEKTEANLYLKQIALKSIKDASPFPAFPKELDYPQLTFNVIISFEVE
jgi:TonB family protein